MPDFRQFPDVTGQKERESSWAIGVNFMPPVEVGEDETPKEAVQKWGESTSDEEMGRYLKNTVWEYW